MVYGVWCRSGNKAKVGHYSYHLVGIVVMVSMVTTVTLVMQSCSGVIGDGILCHRTI